MFHQPLTPVGNSLTLSFMVALLPIAVVLVLLGVLKRPAWQAAGAGLLTGLGTAVAIWDMPLSTALAAAANGAVFAFWPVMWINITVASGRFAAFREWITTSLPPDRRVILIVIGFCFGALLEGVAGFGAPVAITASLLIMVGFPALDALVFVLIFDTTPVAFGALGAPVTVLAAVTGLPAASLAAMIGRQLPFIAAVLPFYVIGLYGGRRSLRALWPMLLVAGLSFGGAQFAASNYFDYTLADIFSALTSLIVTVLFLQIWQPAPDADFRVVTVPPAATDNGLRATLWTAWLPWFIVCATVIVWTFLKIARFAQQSIHWPGLDNAVAITLYADKPYAAVWLFQPLGTGTAILAAALATALAVRLPWRELLRCAALTIRQIWVAVVSVMLIVALAYVMNYSGIAYTLGLAAASGGRAFVLFSPFLGWIAVFLSGSDTSGNALFGNLQMVAARQLHLNPLLFAATNSSGGVLAKMISPQNIATGMSVTDLKGQEGVVLARTFWHSIVLTLMLVVIVILQQYVVPGVIPSLER
jgi:lactate permease